MDRRPATWSKAHRVHEERLDRIDARLDGIADDVRFLVRRVSALEKLAGAGLQPTGPRHPPQVPDLSVAPSG